MIPSLLVWLSSTVRGAFNNNISCIVLHFISIKKAMPQLSNAKQQHMQLWYLFIVPTEAPSLLQALRKLASNNRKAKAKVIPGDDEIQHICNCLSPTLSLFPTLPSPSSASHPKPSLNQHFLALPKHLVYTSAASRHSTIACHQ